MSGHLKLRGKGKSLLDAHLSSILTPILAPRLLDPLAPCGEVSFRRDADSGQEPSAERMVHRVSARGVEFEKSSMGKADFRNRRHSMSQAPGYGVIHESTP